jgi:hypothetical protein
MQAFYFKTGIGAPACTKSPDALVVQGPEKVAVDITANGANIRISSTIALRTLEGNKMQVITVHGSAKVNGVIVPIGYTTTVQLSDDGKSIIAEPSEPRPLTQDELAELQWLELIPTDVLNQCAEHSARADLVIVAGTSATVYPAAGFALEVKQRGGILIEVNLYDSEITRVCDLSLRGGSAEVLPRLVALLT